MISSGILITGILMVVVKVSNEVIYCWPLTMGYQDPCFLFYGWPVTMGYQDPCFLFYGWPVIMGYQDPCFLFYGWPVTMGYQDPCFLFYGWPVTMGYKDAAFYFKAVNSSNWGVVNRGMKFLVFSKDFFFFFWHRYSKGEYILCAKWSSNLVHAARLFLLFTDSNFMSYLESQNHFVCDNFLWIFLLKFEIKLQTPLLYLRPSP